MTNDGQRHVSLRLCRIDMCLVQSDVLGFLLNSLVFPPRDIARNPGILRMSTSSALGEPR